jgi:hypothetical protein
MNDRAIELYKQAGAKAYELCKERGYDVGAIDTIWVSMMAATLSELIVKECVTHIEEDRFYKVDLLETEYDDGYVDGMGHAERILKEHFGVEE